MPGFRNKLSPSVFFYELGLVLVFMGMTSVAIINDTEPQLDIIRKDFVKDMDGEYIKRMVDYEASLGMSIKSQVSKIFNRN